MTTKQFIKKAIEGGWDWNDTRRLILLDPLAWQAVGKVEGWLMKCMGYDSLDPEYDMTCYLCNMHRMIDALAEGKTIEEFLETL